MLSACIVVEQVGPANFVVARRGDRAALLLGPFSMRSRAEKFRELVVADLEKLSIAQAFALGQLYARQPVADDAVWLELEASALVWRGRRTAARRGEALTPIGRAVARALAFDVGLSREQVQ